MSEQSRIKDFPPEQMTPELNEVLKDVIDGRGYVLTPFKIWVYSPDVAVGMERLGAAVTKGTSLSRREREIAVLMIANHWKAEYVWTNHVRHCLKLGFAPEVVEAIRAGKRPVLEDERERAVYDLCVISLEEGSGSDDVFDRAEKLLGRRGIAEVLAVLGYFGMVAMSLKLHRVPVLDDDAHAAIVRKRL
jgi:4-carboxymuconolactone decarboxylase